MDYEITQKGELFKGTKISRKSIAALVVKLAETPGLEVRHSIGVNKPNTTACRLPSRDMGSKLIIYYPFGYWNFDESIMEVYICGTHYALKFVQKQEKAKGSQRAAQKI